MSISNLHTPALLLDRTRLVRNLERMSARARSAGVALRPHLKTAKSAAVAALATADHAGAITVSTLAEARYFFEHGVRDMTYAVCMVPARMAEAATLARRGAELTLITDDPAVVPALDREARALGVRFRVLIEIDSGGRRTGVAWDAPAVLAIAAALDQAGALELGGVLTHAGHSYACRSVAAIKEVAEEERRAVVSAAARLVDAGHACATVSAGSTPTAVHAASFEGLTEIRPGVYMFFDLMQHGLGACAVSDIALSVLATVISHRPERDHLVIDAGALALSLDTSAQAVLPDAGHGWIMTADGRERIGDLRVARVNQEHGLVEGARIPYDALPVGSKVRVLPAHACMTAAAYPDYVVVDGDEVVDRWPRVNGW